jgi:hypothetical protein
MLEFSNSNTLNVCSRRCPGGSLNCALAITTKVAATTKRDDVHGVTVEIIVAFACADYLVKEPISKLSEGARDEGCNVVFAVLLEEKMVGEECRDCTADTSGRKLPLLMMIMEREKQRRRRKVIRVTLGPLLVTS